MEKAFLFFVLPVLAAGAMAYFLNLAMPEEEQAAPSARRKKTEESASRASELVDSTTIMRHASRRDERQAARPVPVPVQNEAEDPPEQSPMAYSLPEDFDIREFRSAHDSHQQQG